MSRPSAPTTRSFRFPKGVRLRKRAEFQRVQSGGTVIRSRHLVVLHLPRPGGPARFGLVVSRKVGNAVVRNRVKRWLREAIRHHRHGLTGVDVVLIARPNAATAGCRPLGDQVVRALVQLRHRHGLPDPRAAGSPEGP